MLLPTVAYRIKITVRHAFVCKGKSVSLPGRLQCKRHGRQDTFVPVASAPFLHYFLVRNYLEILPFYVTIVCRDFAADFSAYDSCCAGKGRMLPIIHQHLKNFVRRGAKNNVLLYFLHFYSIKTSIAPIAAKPTR